MASRASDCRGQFWENLVYKNFDEQPDFIVNITKEVNKIIQQYKL